MVQLNLKKGQIIKDCARENDHLKVSCERGTVWITQEGEPGDFVLRDGGNFSVHHSGLVLIQGLTDAELILDYQEAG